MNINSNLSFGAYIQFDKSITKEARDAFNGRIADDYSDHLRRYGDASDSIHDKLASVSDMDGNASIPLTFILEGKKLMAKLGGKWDKGEDFLNQADMRLLRDKVNNPNIVADTMIKISEFLIACQDLKTVELEETNKGLNKLV